MKREGSIKQILNISMFIIVMHLISTEALPTFLEEIDQSTAYQKPKDIIFEFFLEKANEHKIAYITAWTQTYTRFLQSYSEFLETQKTNGHKVYDAKIHQDLKSDLEHLVESFKNFQNDQLDCSLQLDMMRQISKFNDRKNIFNLDFGFDDDKQVQTWELMNKETRNILAEDGHRIFHETNELLPELIEKYKLGLSENESYEFESLLEGMGNNYGSFYLIYKRKLTTYGDDGDGDDCEKQDLKMVVKILEFMMHMSMDYYLH